MCKCSYCEVEMNYINEACKECTYKLAIAMIEEEFKIEMTSDEYFTRDDPFATKEINTVHQDEQFDASEDYMWNEELPF